MESQLLEQFLQALLVGTEEEVLRAIQRLRQAKVKVPEMTICPSDLMGTASRGTPSEKSLFEGTEEIPEERP